MEAKPHSLSWPDDIDDLINQRAQQERMTRSEYVRKCIREEAQRSQAQRLLALTGAGPFGSASPFAFAT